MNLGNPSVNLQKDYVSLTIQKYLAEFSESQVLQETTLLPVQILVQTCTVELLQPCFVTFTLMIKVNEWDMSKDSGSFVCGQINSSS